MPPRLTFTVQLINAQAGEQKHSGVSLIGLLNLLSEHRNELRPFDTILLTVEPPDASQPARPPAV